MSLLNDKIASPSNPVSQTANPRYEVKSGSNNLHAKVIGNDAFQEADVTGITRFCTKWNYLVKDIRELPRVINEAFMIATSGRPGPVLVDLPKDITTMACPEEVDDSPRPHVLKRKAF